MGLMLDVVLVRAKPDYALLLKFENGEKRVCDMSPYMNKNPFVRLMGSPLFGKTSVDYEAVVWPGDVDIASETLYDRSYPVSPGIIHRPSPSSNKQGASPNS
jgi:hypothetical protein